jgi:hypothetical protein
MLILNRMLRDAQYFKTKFGALDETNSAGDFLVHLVKNKFVPKAAEAPAVSDTLESNGEARTEVAKEQQPQQQEATEDTTTVAKASTET